MIQGVQMCHTSVGNDIRREKKWVWPDLGLPFGRRRTSTSQQGQGRVEPAPGPCMAKPYYQVLPWIMFHVAQPIHAFRMTVCDHRRCLLDQLLQIVLCAYKLCYFDGNFVYGLGYANDRTVSTKIFTFCKEKTYIWSCKDVSLGLAKKSLSSR